MRILIVGASGLVGRHCHQEALARGHEVLGTFRKNTGGSLVSLDIKDPAAIERVLETFRPEAVLCCAAWSWVDGCEADVSRAFAENRDAPARLARAVHASGGCFLHFSSSYVFDGEAGPYSECDTPNPISIYGKSKLEGELEVQAATEQRSIIVRTMGVFGIENLRKNFVYQVVKSLSSGNSISVPNDQLGNATHAIDLARGALTLMDRKEQGTWNLAGDNPSLNRVDFARYIAARLSLNSDLIRPIPTTALTQPARRPLHGGLSIDKALKSLNWAPGAMDNIAWESYLN